MHCPFSHLKMLCVAHIVCFTVLPSWDNAKTRQFRFTYRTHCCFVTRLLTVKTNQSFLRSYFLSMSNIRDNVRFPRATGRTSKVAFRGLRALTPTVTIDILLSQFSSIKSSCWLIFLNSDSNLSQKKVEKLSGLSPRSPPLCAAQVSPSIGTGSTFDGKFQSATLQLVVLERC